MLNTTERDAVASGYVRCPNVDTRWYAGSPGLPEMPKYFAEMRIEETPKSAPMPQDTWPVAVYVRTYGGGLALHSRYETWAAYMDKARELGTLSEPGLAAWSQGWCD